MRSLTYIKSMGYRNIGLSILGIERFMYTR